MSDLREFMLRAEHDFKADDYGLAVGVRAIPVLRGGEKPPTGSILVTALADVGVGEHGPFREVRSIQSTPADGVVVSDRPKYRALATGGQACLRSRNVERIRPLAEESERLARRTAELRLRTARLRGQRDPVKTRALCDDLKIHHHELQDFWARMIRKRARARRFFSATLQWSIAQRLRRQTVPGPHDASR